MKTESLKKCRTLLVGVALTVGLVYSVGTLVLTPNAYASSCDCTETLQDASQYCQVNYFNPAVEDYICPWNVDGAEFKCVGDPIERWQRIPCGI